MPYTLKIVDDDGNAVDTSAVTLPTDAVIICPPPGETWDRAFVADVAAMLDGLVSADGQRVKGIVLTRPAQVLRVAPDAPTLKPSVDTDTLRSAAKAMHNAMYRITEDEMRYREFAIRQRLATALMNQRGYGRTEALSIIDALTEAFKDEGVRP